MIRKIPNWLLYTALFLIAFRVILPSICLWGINYALAHKMENYTGRLEDFDLTLYRGAYQLQGLTIKKKNSNHPPIIRAHEIDISIAWRALFRGEITADTTVRSVTLHLIDDEQGKNDQFGADEPAESRNSALNVIFPITLESLRIRNSEIIFYNSSLGAKIPVHLSKANLTALSLRTPNANSNENSNQLTASPFVFDAILQNHAPIKASGEMDILNCPSRLDVDLIVENFDVTTLNRVLRNYLPLDVTRGQFSLYLEAASHGPHMKGYAKAFLKDGDIIASEQTYDSANHYFSEIGIGFANWVLKNKETETMALRLPFEVSAQGFKADLSKTLWSAVENKEYEPLKPGIDGSIALSSLKNTPLSNQEACERAASDSNN